MLINVGLRTESNAGRTPICHIRQTSAKRAHCIASRNLLLDFQSFLKSTQLHFGHSTAARHKVQTLSCVADQLASRIDTPHTLGLQTAMHARKSN